MKKVYVELASSCNLRCKMCFRHNWFDEEAGLMPPEIVERLRFILREEDFETVFFGGMGEPLLHPALPELLRIASLAGKRTQLITNGTLLRGGTAEALANISPDRIWISMDGFSKRSYEAVRRGGVYETVTANLRAFRRLNPKTQIGITFVMMKENLDELNYINAFADEMQVDLLHLSHLLPGSPLPKEDDLYEEALSIGEMERFTVRRQEKAVDHCPFIAGDACFIRFDGSICPCMQLLHNSYTYLYTERRRVYAQSYGNIKSASLREIWDSPEYAAFRGRVEAFAYPCCTVCLGCEDRWENRTDCMYNEAPTCGACLWAQGVIRCP